MATTNKQVKAKAPGASKTATPTKTATKVATKRNNYAQEVLEGILDVVGEGEAQLLGSDGLAIKIKGVISTQCATIDAAIGRGGIPRSRLTILHGAEGSGKTTLALHIVAQTQKLGGVAVYVDKEYKLDPDYAKSLGVVTEGLVLLQPPYLERAFRQFEAIIDKAAKLREEGERVPILIVLDSMNAAITKAQYDGEWEDKHMAPQARVYSELLPKLMPKVHKEDVSLLWISQVRKKMNVMFGDDSEIAGGNAPKFYASLIMEVGRRAATNQDGVKIGNKIEVYCKKNQIAPPFKKGKCEIIYGKGIDQEAALIEQAISDKVCKLGGSWYSYGEQRLGQGMPKAAQALRDDPKLAKEILTKLEKINKWER